MTLQALDVNLAATQLTHLQHYEQSDEDVKQYVQELVTHWGSISMNFIKHGCSPEDIGAVRLFCFEFLADAAKQPGLQLRAWLDEALETAQEPVEYQKPSDAPGLRPPQFPFGITRLDHLTDGGGSGMTVIGGMPKVGKSLLAMGATISTALTKEWRCVYVNGELNSYTIANRTLAYHRKRHELDEHPIYFNAVGLLTPKALVERIKAHVEISDERVLITLDSANRLADMMGTPNFFRDLKLWENLARCATRISGGRIAFLVVSELNQKGSIKGESMTYAADLVVRMQEGSAEDLVDISVPLSRSSASGDPGTFRRDWRTGRFEWLSA